MRINILKRLKTLLLSLLVGLSLMACGGGGGSDSAGSGTLQVGLTDLPSEAYNSVTITVKEVDVVSDEEEDGDVFRVFTLNNSVSVNVLDYKDHSLRLGEGTIPAISYSQIRLVLEENPEIGEPVNYVMLNCSELIEENDCNPEQKWPLKTPSGHTSGLKILLPEHLVMVNGEVVLLTIDFDPETAIVERGDWDPAKHEDKERFLIKPTSIRVVQEGVDDTYGILLGSVEYSDFPDPGPLTVVTALNSTTLAPVAATLVDPGDATDDFKFFLDAGDYDLKVMADGYNSLSDGPFTVTESSTAPHPETDAEIFILDPLP